MSNYRNAVYRRTHQERGQILSRRRYGLLEKKKDYKLRAQDYHRKKDRLQDLQEKAAQRNPDEFYFKMANTHIKDGKHVVKRVGKKRSHDEMLEMKTQDITYLQNERMVEQKKIDKLLASSSVFHVPSQATRVNLSGPGKAPSELGAVAAHYSATPQVLEKSEPNPLDGNLDQPPLQRVSKRELKKMDKLRIGRYRQVLARMERKEKIEERLRKLIQQKNLMGKGRHAKHVKYDKFGDVIESETVYKWALERKR